MSTTLDCGHGPSEHETFTTGYGVDAQGHKHCYACCATNDKASMVKDGRATLYLTIDKATGAATASNWPGSLRFTVGHVKTGRHNMAGTRYDVWFAGPDAKVWHGTQYGENTQILHCRRATAGR
jgi:hypothetical protein